MSGERIFDISRISEDNLGVLAEEQSKNLEMHICELSFVAEKIARSLSELYRDGMSVSDVMAYLSEEIASSSAHEPDPEVNSQNCFIRRFNSFVKGIDKANLAVLLKEKMSECDVDLDEKDFLPSYNAESSFSYVRNSLSDEAYEVFSEEFEDPRVFYADNFKGAAAAVADGKVGYCILPFEERGMRIPSIANLISRFDLKVCALTPVFGFEGTADMKYALVGKGFVIPEIDDSTDRYLEINVDKNSTASVADLLSALEYLGASVFRVNTISGDSLDEKNYFSVIIKDEGRSFTEILIYLSIFAESYYPVGIYKNIE